VNSPWLKCSDAARTLGRSRAVVERLARLGKIATTVEHGRVLYSAADVARQADEPETLDVANPINRLLQYGRKG
jgi:hypothetical protein